MGTVVFLLLGTNLKATTLFPAGRPLDYLHFQVCPCHCELLHLSLSVTALALLALLTFKLVFFLSCLYSSETLK